MSLNYKNIFPELILKEPEVDVCDRIYKANEKFFIPSSVNHISHLLPIRNQENRNTSYAHVVSCIKEFQENATQYYSPQFICNQIDDQDVRSVFQILLKKGVCTEKDYPYGTVKKQNEKISRLVTCNARQHTIFSYERIENLRDLKYALYENGPCLMTFPVYSFHNECFWKKQNEYDRLLGYQAVTIVGYSDKNQMFLVRNSWGKRWGIHGYSIYPYEDWGLHVECWTVIDFPNHDKENRNESEKRELRDHNAKVTHKTPKKKDVLTLFCDTVKHVENFIFHKK
jgi:hypothetical protein